MRYKLRQLCIAWMVPLLVLGSSLSAMALAASDSSNGSIPFSVSINSFPDLAATETGPATTNPDGALVVSARVNDTAGPTTAAEEQSGSDVTITVVMSDTVAPVPGAFVALTGAAGQYGGVTDNAGQLLLSDVVTGSYTAAASAPGTTVGSAPVTVASSPVTATITVTDSGTIFHGHRAYGSQTGGIVADGKSGVFYLNTTAIPSLFRTGDYGGTWAPVTISTDDSDDGIDGTTSVANPATSGYPGEIAAVAGDKIWYSRDFGVTWASFPVTGTPTLFWGHVGTTSILFAVDEGSTTIAYTPMPTHASPSVVPSLTPMANSFKLDAGDSVFLANGATQPIMAVASHTGSTVTLYEVTSTPDRLSASSVTVSNAAPASAPTFVRLGGSLTGPTIGSSGQAPNTILVYSDAAGAAVMSTYASGAWTSTTATVFKQPESEADDPSGSFNSGPSSCGGQSDAIGSVSPLGSVGSVAGCWVTQSGITLTVRHVVDINNNTGMAFDAAYDGTTNLVLISNDGARGAIKSARMDAARGGMRPEFPGWPAQAQPGTAPDSGGVSINGINSAVVKDTAFGQTADEMAVMLSFSGGGRTLATSDRGTTWVTIDSRGGSSIDWWPNATPGSSWILAGSGGAGDLLASLEVTSTGILTTSVVTYLNNTSGTDLGLTGVPENSQVTAIAGISSTHKAYVGTTDMVSKTGTLRLVTLGGGSSAIITAPVSGITQMVRALDHCPTAGSASVVSDTLFVALGATTEAGSDGGLRVVHDATAASPTVSTPAITGDFNDVRAGCATGEVWAGKTSVLPGTPPSPGISGLLKSTDGGATFVTVVITGPSVTSQLQAQFANVETLAVSQDNPDFVIVVSRDGDIVSTRDGGTTWIVHNDTTSPAGRHFGAEKPGDIEIPPTPVIVQQVRSLAASSTESALFGSGAGLFNTDLSAAPPSPACYDFAPPTGIVGVEDIQLVASRWRLTAANPDPDGLPDTPNYDARYDVDNDGVINIVDVVIVAGHLGACP